MDITNLKEHSQSLGFRLRGGQLTGGAVVSRIPDSLAGAEMSICGIKGFMVDEVREFRDAAGASTSVDCAAVACLEITDSPVHMHGETLETYIILQGSGRMLVGDEVIVLEPGIVVTLPPGVPHGACSDSDEPVKVLMTFTPGLAPKDLPAYRDEKILHHSTRDVIADK